jgi:hypothetical protein
MERLRKDLKNKRIVCLFPYREDDLYFDQMLLPENVYRRLKEDLEKRKKGGGAGEEDL